MFPLSRACFRPLLARLAMSSSSLGGTASAAAAVRQVSTETRYKVYTKTGDGGTSSLYNGERRSKDDEFFSALGDVDELNASVGLAREYCIGSSVALEAQLVEIQCRLLDVGSAIATPILSSNPGQLERAKFHTAITASLEAWIDAMDEELPPLKNFILPSGGLASAQLHVARTIARRAERQAVSLVREGQLAGEVAVFLNRLSDYLFVAARFASLKSGGREEVYKKPREKREKEGGEGAE